MDQYGPGSMTSTHAAAPLGCAAASANIDIMIRENLADKSASGGRILMAGLHRIRDAYPEHIGAVNGKGMVAALCMVKPGTDDSDPDTAHTVVEKCFQKGLLMFAPVGPGGGTIKISPPVNMPEDVINESVGILEEAVNETLG
jgi:4-aminobutyrate aminotransferase-like enzyme